MNEKEAVRLEAHAIHIFVTGKVQGVYFRASTAKQANKLKLQGWVKNLPDARVEIHAQGADASLQQLLQWCQKGPMLAKVSDVSQQLANFDEQLCTFEVRR